MKINENSSTVEHSNDDSISSITVNAASMKKLSRILSRNIYDMSGSFVREAFLNARESVDKRANDLGVGSTQWRGQDSTRPTEIILPNIFVGEEEVNVDSIVDEIESKKDYFKEHFFNAAKTKKVSYLDSSSGVSCNSRVFSIRDYGLGMTDEDFRNLILSFGSSLKAEDNQYGGGMGIGSLSAFSMTDEIVYECFKDGIKNTYRIMDYGEVVVHSVQNEETEELDGVRMSCEVDFITDNSGISNDIEKSFKEYTQFIREVMGFIIFSPDNEYIDVIIPQAGYINQNEDDLYCILELSISEKQLGNESSYSRQKSNRYVNIQLLSGYTYDKENKNPQVGYTIAHDGSIANAGYLFYENSLRNNFSSNHTPVGSIFSSFQANNLAVLIDGCLYRGTYSSPIFEKLESYVKSQYENHKYANDVWLMIDTMINDGSVSNLNSLHQYPLCVPVGYYSVEDDMNPSRETVKLSDKDIETWCSGIMEYFKEYAEFNSSVLDLFNDYYEQCENEINKAYFDKNSTQYNDLYVAKKVLESFPIINAMEFDKEKIVQSLRHASATRYNRMYKLDYESAVKDLFKDILDNDYTVQGLADRISDVFSYTSSVNINRDVNRIILKSSARNQVSSNDLGYQNIDGKNAVCINFFPTKSAANSGINQNAKGVNITKYFILGTDESEEYTIAIGYDENGSSNLAPKIVVWKITDEDKELLNKKRVISKMPMNVHHSEVSQMLKGISDYVQEENSDEDKDKLLVKESEKDNPVADSVISNSGIIAGCPGLYGKAINVDNDGNLSIFLNISSEHEYVERTIYVNTHGAEFASAKNMRDVSAIINGKSKKNTAKNLGAKYTILTYNNENSVMKINYGTKFPELMEYSGLEDSDIYIFENSAFGYFIYPSDSDKFNIVKNVGDDIISRSLTSNLSKLEKSLNSSQVEDFENGFMSPCLGDIHVNTNLFRTLLDKNTVIVYLDKSNLSVDSATKTINKSGYEIDGVFSNSLDFMRHIVKESSDEKIKSFVENVAKKSISQPMDKDQAYSIIQLFADGNNYYSLRHEPNAKNIVHKEIAQIPELAHDFNDLVRDIDNSHRNITNSKIIKREVIRYHIGKSIGSLDDIDNIQENLKKIVNICGNIADINGFEKEESEENKTELDKINDNYLDFASVELFTKIQNLIVELGLNDRYREELDNIEQDTDYEDWYPQIANIFSNRNHVAHNSVDFLVSILERDCSIDPELFVSVVDKI